MADDTDFSELAAHFPEAVLALIGVAPSVRYRAEALEIKGSGRFDTVLTATDESNPLATRYYFELQDRHQKDLLLRLLMKIAIHVVQVGNHRPVEAVVLYTEERFMRSAAPPIIRGEGEPTAFLRVTSVVLDRLSPELLERAGWKAWVALPLVGTRDAILANARRWFDALERASEPTPDEHSNALELFLRLLAGRLPEFDMYALLQREEVVVKDTATGRAIMAVGEAKGEAKGLRLAILDVLSVRGLSVPEDARARLEAETDLERLQAIRRAARTVGPDLAGLFD
jgi:hypothetical protein